MQSSRTKLNAFARVSFTKLGKIEVQNSSILVTSKLSDSPILTSLHSPSGQLVLVWLLCELVSKSNI